MPVAVTGFAGTAADIDAVLDADTAAGTAADTAAVLDVETAAVTAAFIVSSYWVACVRMTRQRVRSRMRAKGLRCLVTLTAACTTCKQTPRLTTRSKKRKGRSAWTRSLSLFPLPATVTASCL